MRDERLHQILAGAHVQPGEAQQLAREVYALREEVANLKAFIDGVAINCRRVSETVKTTP